MSRSLILPTLTALGLATLLAGCAFTPQGQCEADGLTAGTPEFDQCVDSRTPPLRHHVPMHKGGR